MLTGEVCLGVGNGDPVDVGLVPLDHGSRNSRGRALLVLVVQVDGHQGTSHATVLLSECPPFGPQALLLRVLGVVRAAEENSLEAPPVTPPQLSYNQASINSQYSLHIAHLFRSFFNHKPDYLRCKRSPHPDWMGFSLTFRFGKIRFKNAALTGECVQP